MTEDIREYKEIKIDNFNNYENLNEFLNILENQIKDYKKNNQIFKLLKKKQKKLILFYIYTLLLQVITIVIFKKWLTLIIIGVLFIFTTILIMYAKKINNKKIRARIRKRDNIELHIKVETNSHWDYLISGVPPSMVNRKIYNIFINIPYIKIMNGSSEMFIFPYFIIELNKEKATCISGQNYIERISYNSKIVDEYSARHNYKYREFSYERWKYQRKDGGPDRRYNYNVVYRYYKVEYLFICGQKIDIKSKDKYLEIINNLNSKKTSVEMEIISNEKKILESSLESLIGIRNNLIKNNINYNDYGESIEFVFKDKPYIINNLGIDIKSGIKFSKIIGGK